MFLLTRAYTKGIMIEEELKVHTCRFDLLTQNGWRCTNKESKSYGITTNEGCIGIEECFEPRRVLDLTQNPLKAKVARLEGLVEELIAELKYCRHCFFQKDAPVGHCTECRMFGKAFWKRREA